MRVNGKWVHCDDGEMRPIVEAHVLGADQIWRASEFLVDTGADRTVISGSALAASSLQPVDSDRRIGGLGGAIESVVVRTALQLTRADAQAVVLRGEFAAFVQEDEYETGILGRDILDMFALIVDRRADVVAILGGKHRYLIQQDA
jgi:predicted aspartyl protease